MNQRAVLAAASASLAIALTTNAALAAPAKMEKCYGIAQVGQNDCANLSGSHSCAGQAKLSQSPDDWKYVAAGTCASLDGLTAAQAKERLKSPGKQKPT